jgi:ssDNA-binding Zn-finger/Zn-ribbon topoisomerase 1
MNSSASYAPIDLNDYLEYLPRHQRRGYHECPACNGKLGISRGNGEKFTCYGGCSHSDIRRAILALAGDNTQSNEFEAARAARATRADEKAAAEKARIERLKKSDERDRDWQGIINDTFLTDTHRQDMLDRGYTPELIERSQARSSAQHGGGRVIPILDYQGQMVGGQVITASGKPWYGEAGTNQLKETGEIPLTVIYPDKWREGTYENKATQEIKYRR